MIDTATTARVVRSASELGVAPGESFAFHPDPPPNMPLPDRLAAAVAEFGPHPALVECDRVVTFDELDEITDRWSAWIRGSGAGPKTAVGLLLGHTIDQALALLAVLRAGRIAVVLDPSQPDEWLRSQLADSGARLVVGTEDQRERLDALAAGRDVATVEDWAGDAPPSSPATVAVDDPAIIYYTSGTSGEAKGVVVNQSTEPQPTFFDVLGPGDRIALVLPMSFKLGAALVFISVLNGASLHLFDLRSEGLPALPDWVARERITFLSLVAPMVRALAEADAEPWSGLRLLSIAGEQGFWRDVRIARRLFGPQAVVLHFYGATETSLIATYVVPPDADADRDGPLPAGFPFANSIEIVDEDGRRLPPGKTGDIIVVDSRWLAAGYWGRPDLTERAFPVSTDGRRSYRTGDVGHLGEDGVLVVAGRSDVVVKVRGNSVDLGAVELAFRSAEAVRDVFVAAATTDRWTLLVAHVVVDDAGVTPAWLRDYVAARLPGYMVPPIINVVDDLPVLPNGKVDRRRLSVLTVEQAEGVEYDDELSTPTQHLVAASWEKVLGHRAFGAHSDFFDMGGESLLAIEMLVDLEKRTGRRIPLSSLLDTATIQAIAAQVDAGELPDASRIHLNEVQPGAAGRPPLYFFPYATGTAFELRDLGQAIGLDQPLLGFDSLLLEGVDLGTDALTAMADRFTEELTEVDPDGPYHLAGYSFGGAVAYEVARRLVAGGREVAFVGVVDIGPDVVTRSMSDRPGPSAAELEAPNSQPFRWRAPIRSLGLDARLMLFLERHRWDSTIGPRLWRRDLRRAGRIRAPWRRAWARDAVWRSLKNHRFEPYDGELVVLSTPIWDDPERGWMPFVRRLEVRAVEGDHTGLMEPPSVETVGRELRAGLDGVLVPPDTVR